MFRWLRERRQRRQAEAAERRAQLRDKAQAGGLAGARKKMSYYSDSAAPPQQQDTSDSVAQGFAMQLIAQQMARDLSDSGPRHHVTQVHHGSGDNIAASTSRGHGHSSHDYGSSHHSSHDSGSYDSGSSSSGSDSSW